MWKMLYGIVRKFGLRKTLPGRVGLRANEMSGNWDHSKEPELEEPELE